MRLIDADPLYQKINDWRKQIKTTCGERDDYVECLGEVLTFIGSEPNAEVVEVVRCHDCEYWDETTPMSTTDPTFCRCRLRREDFGMTAEDFCSYGRRKEKTDER